MRKPVNHWKTRKQSYIKWKIENLFKNEKNEKMLFIYTLCLYEKEIWIFLAIQNNGQQTEEYKINGSKDRTKTLKKWE